MKIFSNFDTELSNRLLKEAAEKYGNEFVLCVRRGKVYLLVRLFFPVLLRIFLSVLLLWIYFTFFGTRSSVAEEVGFFVWGLIASMSLYLVYFALKKMMNFYMDFVIITPDQLVSYDQEGVLTRTTRSLELRKIKTVNVVTDGWLSSVFGYGSIVFLAEGDMQHGDVKLNFIMKPVELRNIIYGLIDHRASMKDEDGSVRAVNKERDGDDEYA